MYDRYIDEGITGTQAKKRPAFLRMLEDAINSLLGKTPIASREVEIKLSISAFISDNDIAEDRVRLELYRRLSRCGSVHDVLEIEEEMVDRFGKLDVSTKQFLQLIEIKILATQQNIVLIRATSARASTA